MGFLYSIQISEISHQTFGLNRRKCTTFFANAVSCAVALEWMPQDLTDDYNSALVGVVRPQAITWTNVDQVLPPIFCHLTRMSEALFDWFESMKIDVALMDGIIRYWFLHRSVGF